MALLEAAVLRLRPAAAAWSDEVGRKVLAVGEEQPEAVGEFFIGLVAGPGAWAGFPPPVQEMITANGPAILAEFRGGVLDVTAEELGSIQAPVLLVASEDSPEPFREVTAAMAEAIPNAETVLVPGGHLISPATAAVVDFVRRRSR